MSFDELKAKYGNKTGPALMKYTFISGLEEYPDGSKYYKIEAKDNYYLDDFVSVFEITVYEDGTAHTPLSQLGMNGYIMD